MRSIFGITVLAALVSAAPAAAGGINLSWNDCGAAGAENKTFACNVNTGDPFRLYASFVAPPGIDRLNGCESEVLFDFDAVTVPSWWAVHNSGTCRQTSMSMTVLFGGAGVPPSTCFDPWNGLMSSGFEWTIGYGAQNRARFRMLGAMPPNSEIVVPAGMEAYAFAIVINRAKTLGTSCGGCGVGACVALTSIKLNELTDHVGVIESTLLTGPALRQHVTWQSGVPACPGATAVPARTWGAVKMLYR